MPYIFIFKFGNTSDRLESIYESDYNPNSSDEGWKRPKVVTAPKDSHVMHNNPVTDETVGMTSHGQDFPSRVYDMCRSVVSMFFSFLSNIFVTENLKEEIIRSLSFWK